MSFKEPRFEKVLTKKVITYILITFVLIFLSFYLGLQQGRSITPFESQGGKFDSENSIQTCAIELELCLTDQASSDAPTKETYEPATFGIYSPLFENKEVEYQSYTYRKNTIEKRTVQVEIENNSTAYVSTWKLLQPAGYLPKLPERLRIRIKRNPTDLTYDLFDFPIFDGYEFQTVISKEKFVSARIPENPLPSDVYTSKKGIKMYRSRLACPKSDCGAELHFLTTVDNGKTQMFAQISAGFNVLELDLSEFESATNQKFRELEKIADTIDFENY